MPELSILGRRISLRGLSHGIGSQVHLKKGEVWVKDARIVYIGEADKLKAGMGKDFPEIRWDREVDCGGNLLMPGFKDAHTHRMESPPNP